MTKAKLEGLFADELVLLQPTPGYMRLLKESVLQIWKARKAAVREELVSAERVAKAIQDKLDRLDEAFLSLCALAIICERHVWEFACCVRRSSKSGPRYFLESMVSNRT